MNTWIKGKDITEAGFYLYYRYENDPTVVHVYQGPTGEFFSCNAKHSMQRVCATALFCKLPPPPPADPDGC